MCVLGSDTPTTSGTSPRDCRWPLLQGDEVKSPQYAPVGNHKYIIMSQEDGGSGKILNTLQRNFDDAAAVSELKELKFMNMVVGRLSDRAIRWLCEQEDLRNYIAAIELDQPVQTVENEPLRTGVRPVM